MDPITLPMLSPDEAAAITVAAQSPVRCQVNADLIRLAMTLCDKVDELCLRLSIDTTAVDCRPARRAA